MQRELAYCLIREFEERPQLQGGLEGICRLLLVADANSVTTLRDHCLHRLAARFSALAKRTAPQDEQELFMDFLVSIAPKVQLHTSSYRIYLDVSRHTWLTSGLDLQATSAFL